MDFQSHYHDLIYQQLCFSDTNWLGCDNIYGDEDYPDYAYPYSVFDDVSAVFGVTKNGLFYTQNYSIGSMLKAPELLSRLQLIRCLVTTFVEMENYGFRGEFSTVCQQHMSPKRQCFMALHINLLNLYKNNLKIQILDQI